MFKLISLLSLCAFFITGVVHGQELGGTIFNIRSYGAKGDGKTLDTKAIDKAVAACVKAGGGTVLVPAGTFVIGTVRLYSNIELHLAPGAVLLASDNTNDYLFQKD